MDATGDVALTMVPAEDSSSQLTLQSSPNKLMEFHIQLTDMQGKTIDSVRVEEEYWIKVYVRDLRDLPPNSLHLFSANAELYLDSKLFVATGKGRLGGDFWEYRGASKFKDAPNSLQDIESSQIGDSSPFGGIVIAPYPHGAGHLIYQIPVRTVGEGEGVIATKPIENDAASLYETSFYGTNDPIRADSIHFESLPITVLPRATQTSTSLPLPPSTVNLPLQTPDSSGAQPLISQPVTAQPSTTESVVTQLVASFPEATRDSTPKITVVPRQVTKESATATDDQQELQNRIVGEVKVLPQPQSTLEGPHTEEIVRMLVDLAVSRTGFFREISHLGIYQTLSVISHIPLQKRQTDAKSIQGLAQLALPSFVDRLKDSRHQDKTWVAKDVIDRMLERLAPGCSFQAQANRFEWEAIYSRASMRRLPLRLSQHPYDADEFADVDIKLVHSDASESPKMFNAVTDTVGLASSNPSGDLQFAYRRSSMKSLPLLDRSTALTVLGELNQEVTSFRSQTSEISSAEVCELGNSSHAAQESRSDWSSYLLVGLTSIYLIFRGQSRKFLNRRGETRLQGDTSVPENR